MFFSNWNKEPDEEKIYRWTEVFHKLDNRKWKMHTLRTCKKTKLYIYLYISLYENLFENGCIYIYIYTYWIPYLPPLAATGAIYLYLNVYLYLYLYIMHGYSLQLSWFAYIYIYIYKLERCVDLQSWIIWSKTFIATQCFMLLAEQSSWRCTKFENTEQCVVAWHAEIWLVAKRIRSSRGIS